MGHPTNKSLKVNSLPRETPWGEERKFLLSRSSLNHIKSVPSMCGETLYQETKGRVLDRKDKTLWTRSES